MSATTSNHSERLLRRAEAAKYVVETYNVPCSPKTLGKDCLHKFGGAAFSARGTLPALPDLGTGRLGTEEDRPPGPVDVRSPHRRLTPSNETRRRDPSLQGSVRAHRAQKANNMHRSIKTSGQIQGLSSLQLLDRRAVVVHKPTTRAGQYLCRRLPVPPGHADLIAALAGLGSAVDR